MSRCCTPQLLSRHQWPKMHFTLKLICCQLWTVGLTSFCLLKKMIPFSITLWSQYFKKILMVFFWSPEYLQSAQLRLSWNWLNHNTMVLVKQDFYWNPGLSQSKNLHQKMRTDSCLWNSFHKVFSLLMLPVESFPCQGLLCDFRFGVMKTSVVLWIYTGWKLFIMFLGHLSDTGRRNVKLTSKLIWCLNATPFGWKILCWKEIISYFIELVPVQKSFIPFRGLKQPAFVGITAKVCLIFQADRNWIKCWPPSSCHLLLSQ